MTGAVRSNFRGARAWVALPEDQNREVLVRTLERLGLHVTECAPDATDFVAGSQDVVFVDADQDFMVLDSDLPHIALIGIEAPSRLARVVRHRAAAVLMKPVRATGVFTALFLAFNEQAIRHRELVERESLSRRAEGRRVVVKAILKIMKDRDLTDDEAYREMRLASMAKRISIEEFAAEIVAASTSSMRLAGTAAHERKTKQT
jgi:two-component system, response regulator / RNA-binding antiterminator